MLLVRFLADRSGSTSIEYGLIVMLIAIASVSWITAVGQTSTVQLKNVADSLQN